MFLSGLNYHNYLLKRIERIRRLRVRTWMIGLRSGRQGMMYRRARGRLLGLSLGRGHAPGNDPLRIGLLGQGRLRKEFENVLRHRDELGEAKRGIGMGRGIVG